MFMPSSCLALNIDGRALRSGSKQTTGQVCLLFMTLQLAYGSSAVQDSLQEMMHLPLMMLGRPSCQSCM